jgi:hypothetical protein
MLPLKFGNQLAYGKHLTHGNSMHPNGAGLGVVQSSRDKTKALRKARAVLAQAEHLNGPPWQREQRCADQKQIVEDVH